MDTKKPLKAAVSANLYRDANPRPLNLQRHGNYGPSQTARQGPAKLTHPFRPHQAQALTATGASSAQPDALGRASSSARRPALYH